MTVSIFGACKSMQRSELNAVVEKHIMEDSLWDTNRIAICWDGADKADAKFQQAIQTEVTEQFAPTIIRFNGWHDCPKQDFQGIRLYVHKPGREYDFSFAQYPDSYRLHSFVFKPMKSWSDHRQNKTTWEFECKKVGEKYEFMFMQKLTIAAIKDRYAPICYGWSYFSTTCSRVYNFVSRNDRIHCGPDYIGLKAYTR